MGGLLSAAKVFTQIQTSQDHSLVLLSWAKLVGCSHIYTESIMFYTIELLQSLAWVKIDESSGFHPYALSLGWPLAGSRRRLRFKFEHPDCTCSSNGQKDDNLFIANQLFLWENMGKMTINHWINNDNMK